MFHQIPPFSQHKSWEIRRTATKYRGKLYLLESGSQCIVGECELTNCITLSPNIWYENFDKHQITFPSTNNTMCCPYDIITKRYPKPHAWVFDHIIEYNQKIPYEHPKGAVIWVKDVIPKSKQKGSQIHEKG